MKLLLEKGAELEAKDANGRTPLLLAAENGARDGGEAATREVSSKP